MVGINDLTDPLERLTVYPNPSSATITIELPHTTTLKNLSLSILDLNGQELLQRTITDLSTTIDVSALQGGIYVIKVIGEKKVQVGKFVKR